MKQFLTVLMILISFLILFVSGCSDTDISDLPNVYFDAAKQAGPIFRPDRAITPDIKEIGKSIQSKAIWGDPAGLGKPIYEMFGMFRDYDPELDDMSVGLNNIFKLMSQAGSFFNEGQQSGTTVGDTTVTSPFDFGRSDNVYDTFYVSETSTRGNYFATKKIGSLYNGLMCWYSEDQSSDKIEYAIMQGSYNDSTGDLNIDLICYLDIGTTNTASLRTHLEGNTQTKYFSKFQNSRYNWDSGLNIGYQAWYVGAGYSRGDDAFFLLKVKDNEGLSGGEKYFEFPAFATETELQLLDDAGMDAESLTNGAVYQVDVDAITPFDVLDDPAAVLPISESAFTGTGMGNLKPIEMD